MLDQKRPTGVIPYFVREMAFAASSSPEDFAAQHGKGARGLVPCLTAGSVARTFYPSLTLIQGPHDGIVGYAFRQGDETVSVDYRKPGSVRKAAAYLL
jgi:hypothetical protein